MNMTDLFTESSGLIILFVQGLFAWALWSLRHTFVRLDEYTLHVARDARAHQAIEVRLSAIESKIAQLPDTENVNILAQAIESLRGDIKAVDARISGIDRLMVRLERALDKL